MEIGPINAVRPVSMLKPSPVAPDLSRVFETEYRDQSRDDEYTPANKKATHGLEDREDDSAQESLDPGDQPESDPPAPKVSFFA